jgi:hypothetical protein
MKKLLKTTLFLILFLGIYACKKNQLGGKAELKGVVMHHSKPIPNAYIYIKYDATEFPGADYTLYDTYIQADANGNYSFSLYKGSYYVYSYGLDYDILPPYSVKGGLSISIRNREVLTKNIAVTE